eukprot:sb/3462627/
MSLLRHALTRCLSSGPTFNPVCERVVGALTCAVGAENITTSESARNLHGTDESFHPTRAPEAVVTPHTTEQVSAVMRICNENRIPVVPFGTGTGFEGGVGAMYGGISLALHKMTDIVEVNSSDFDATVRAGVTRHQLNDWIKEEGLQFPIDPGAGASVCGMCATSASGTNAVRYGTMRENVLNMEVVLADGRVIHTAGKGSRAKKTSCGYNLTNLFVGSEGTLGVITQATVRLYGVPEATAAAISSFPTIASAVETVVQVLQCGIPVARMEFLNPDMISACNSYSNLDLKVAPTLFFEFIGSPGVRNQYLIFSKCNDDTRSSVQTPLDFASLFNTLYNTTTATVAQHPIAGALQHSIELITYFQSVMMIRESLYNTTTATVAQTSYSRRTAAQHRINHIFSNDKCTQYTSEYTSSPIFYFHDDMTPQKLCTINLDFTNNYNPRPILITLLQLISRPHSPGEVHEDLKTFLQTMLPKKAGKLGVSDSRIGASIGEEMDIECEFGGVTAEIIRGIRFHFAKFVDGLSAKNCDKAQLGLGHSYSRCKVKFNVHRVDNMIIQSISLLDQIDKDINTFSMRLRYVTTNQNSLFRSRDWLSANQGSVFPNSVPPHRNVTDMVEWYSYHYPELVKIAPDNIMYAKVVNVIKSRDQITEDMVTQLEEITMDSAKAKAVIESAKISMVGYNRNVTDMVFPIALC